MATIALLLVFVILAADALYSRCRVALRRRAAAHSPRPAWDLVQPVREGWRALETERPDGDEGQQVAGDDLSRLFRGRRA